MSGTLRCNAPRCRQEGSTLAYDEKFSVNLVFCDEHDDEWLAKDHIMGGEQDV